VKGTSSLYCREAEQANNHADGLRTLRPTMLRELKDAASRRRWPGLQP
jgi:hypothetical protein